jgi:hypothetical protein
MRRRVAWNGRGWYAWTVLTAFRETGFYLDIDR